MFCAVAFSVIAPERTSPALDPAVFKAYDVRGLYPSELDEEGARVGDGAAQAAAGGDDLRGLQAQVPGGGRGERGLAVQHFAHQVEIGGREAADVEFRGQR